MLGRASLIFLVAVASTACGATPQTTRPGTLSARRRPPPSADAPIPSCEDLDPGNAGARVCAIAEIDIESGLVDVFLRLEPDALPEGRREVTLVRGDTSESLGRVEEAAEVRYRVSLEGSEGSFRRSGGWHISGRSILPEVYVDGERVVVPATLLLEVGDAPLFTSAGSEQRVFDAPSLERLAHESYEVGPLAMTRRDVDDVTLWIGSSGLPDGALESAADVLSDAYRRLRDHLGPSSTDTVLITLHASEDATFAVRDGSTVVWSVPPDADLRAELASRLRPLAHLFIPGSHSIEEAWLREGVPEHYASRTANELLGGQDDAFARGVVRSFGRYAASAEGRTLRSVDDAWVVDAGSVAGFCLDGTLRESSSSLDAVLRRALARGDEAVSTETLLEDLAALAPAAAGHLAALVETTGAFAVDVCFERLGLSPRETTFSSWSDAALNEALGVVVSSEAQTLPMLRIDEPSEGSPLRAGDLLMRVGGHAVAQAIDVAWALREASAGDRVELHVYRVGETHLLSRVIPELSDSARTTERVYLELVPIGETTP